MKPFVQRLALGRSDVDRAAHLRNDSEWSASQLYSDATRVVRLRGVEIPLLDDAVVFTGVRDDDVLAILGQADGIVYAAALGETVEYPESWQWTSLRTCGAALTDREVGLATTAIALNNWHKNHTHCPRCGSDTFVTHSGWVRQCVADGSEHYPRTDPAIITLITDSEDRLLLARQPVWPAGNYSVIAGFCEPGETFEAAVIRECLEEVGLHVGEPTYLASQPWPFPASMMIGYHVRALSTEIVVDDDEIEEAMWVSREELVALCADERVKLPSRVSIARKMIEHWYGEELPHHWSRT